MNNFNGEALTMNNLHGVEPNSGHYMHNSNGATINANQYDDSFSECSEEQNETCSPTPALTYNFQQLRAHFDDPCVYANLSEISRREFIEDIDRRPQPPTPSAAETPIRIVSNGWREYKTLGGRSYYFHPDGSVCQWKPPRNTVSGLRRAFTDCESPTTSSMSQFHQQSNSAELFAELPLSNANDLSRSLYGGHELATICEGEVYPIQQQQHQSIIVDHDGGGKSFMSHSVDCALLTNKRCATDRLNNSIAIEIPPTTTTFHHHLGQFPPLPEPHNSNTNGSMPECKAICHGQLEKCRIAENGISLKKREWNSVYAYLYTGHLLFYKDQKSAEKTGKHYPPPSDVCDLRNAIVTYSENERDKRRRHLISLLLHSKTEYLFSCSGNGVDIVNWYNFSTPNATFITVLYHALCQSITLLSPTKVYPHPIISDYCGSLHRSSTRLKAHSSSKSTLHSSIKSKLKPESKSVSPDKSNGIEAETPTRESIIERLLRFFRSRPTMEYLRERGIYKPEPVFGSTLAEITLHEKSHVPKFIVEVTRLIEAKGLEADGLYRVNGNLSAVQRIRCHVDQDKYDAIRNEEDVHVLTGALKLFLRELSEPVFPQSMSKEFMSAIREPAMKQRFRAIDELLMRLPPVNKETLKVLIFHLERVATYSGKNRMQIHNLAIIFGPSLFCAEERVQTRKGSNDKGAKSSKRKNDRKPDFGAGAMSAVEPNQNLAYKMVVYGQIVEFILNEARRLTVLKDVSG